MMGWQGGYKKWVLAEWLFFTGTFRGRFPEGDTPGGTPASALHSWSCFSGRRDPLEKSLNKEDMYIRSPLLCLVGFFGLLL